MKDLLLFALKKELFYCTVAFDRNVDTALLCKIFILIDKYYGGYEIDEEFGGKKNKWHDFVLKDNIKLENLKFNRLKFYFDLPFYFQKGNQIRKEVIAEGCSIAIYSIENNHTTKHELLFNLYADLFTDIVYVLTPPDWKYVERNQKLAARKNRETLTDFLKSLESLLDGNITESLSDYHLNPNSVFKYGIKEDATREKPV